MRILAYRWKAYNYRDIIHWFERMGNVVDVFECRIENYDEAPELEEELQNRLSGENYDFVFTVNYFAAVSRVCEERRIKYVIWTCDNPLISMYHKTLFNDCNYIFTFDRTNSLEFKAMGAKHIWYLPLAVDTERLDAVTAGITPEERRAYSSRISFVGSLYERNSYDRLEPVLPEYLRGYFDAVVQAQLGISGANIIEDMLTPSVLEQLQEYFALEKSEDSFSDLGLVFSTTVLGFKVAAVQRRRALLALAKKLPVAVYSNSDVSDLLRVSCRGSVDYWSQMPKVFHLSEINLNMTIPNIKSGLPLRIWDILGSGGFLMTNYQTELPLFFRENEEFVCFSDEKELLCKAEYYLSHEKERKEIAENGCRRVKEMNTYENRIRFILEKIF